MILVEAKVPHVAQGMTPKRTLRQHPNSDVVELITTQVESVDVRKMVAGLE